MKLGFIIAGLVFLFNPNINIIDVLPDAIGYGLILCGLLPVSRVESNFSEAGRRFRHLFILELCKLPCLYVYSLISAEEQIWILILSLVFGVAEAIFGIMAWNGFFAGLDLFADSEDRGVLYKMKPTHILMLIFTVVKPVLCVLPDLTLLSDGRYGTVTNNGIQSLQSYRGVFNVFAAVLVFLFGIVWLILSIRYMRGVKKEKAFLARIAAKVEEYTSESKTLVFRELSSMLGLLYVTAFLCLELKVEGYSLLPPMVNAVLFLGFFFLQRKRFGKPAKIGLIASAAYLVLSAVGWFMGVAFADKYYIEDVGGGFSESIYYLVSSNFDVFDQLLLLAVPVFLSCVAFAVLFFQLQRLFKRIIVQYTGTPESSIPAREETQAMREHEAAVDASIKRALQKPLPFLTITAFLSALSSALFPLLQVYFSSFFMIDLVIRILFVIFFTSYVSKLRSAVEVKGGIDFD